MTDAPHVLTPAQAAVEAVCAAFGWRADLKAGHVAGWVKRTRTKLGLELPEFVAQFNTHYGRVDPGAGTWWVYREVWPCKGAGNFPTPKVVEESWGRWELAVAVQLPTAQSEPAGFAALRAFREARQGR